MPDEIPAAPAPRPAAAPKPQVPILTDGYASYSGGCHAAAHNPRELSPTQLSLIVNGSVRNGWISNRDGFVEIPLQFPDGESQQIFETGKFQGEEYYGEFERVIYVIDGRIFSVDPLTGRVATHGMTGIKQPLSSREDFAFLEQRDGYVVIQDAVNAPVLLEGTTARAARPADQEVFTGSLMADGWGRLAVVGIERSRIYFSDHELDPESNSRKFTELNDYYLASRFFQPPRRLGPIMAVEFIPFVDAPAGFGPLFAFGKNAAVTYDVSAPRVDGGWVANNIERMTLLGIGACGHRSVIAGDNDMLFRDQYGRVRLLSQAVRDQEQRKNTQRIRQIDREVSPWILNETAWLRRWLDAVAYGDRYLWTCLPDSTWLPGDRRDVWATGMLALNLDVLSNLRGEEEPAWDGLWTGLRPQALTSGNFGGEPRLLILSRDSDGRRRLYEQKRGLWHDWAWCAAAGTRTQKRIEWQMATRWFDFKSPFIAKILTAAMLRIGHIRGRLTIEGFIRREEDDRWGEWFIHHDGASECLQMVFAGCECHICEGGTGAVDRMALPALPWPGGTFRRLQVLFRITGSCEVREIAFEAKPIGQESASDGTVCVEPTALPHRRPVQWDEMSYDAVRAPAAA